MTSPTPDPQPTEGAPMTDASQQPAPEPAPAAASEPASATAPEPASAAPSDPKPRRSRGWLAYGAAFIVGLVAILVIIGLLVNIFTRKAEGETTFVKVVDVQDGETDPAVWGQNFPLEYS